ncbi:MAG: GH3 auxin-responsive promoter family protein, partial [Candidatus Korarchaeota archaeon]|nr:GH3 auxin-responsive promoter family protein [Candidatus Korarchaeota archaeon]
MFPEEANLEVFRPIIGSWYDSLKHPKQYQSQLLSELIAGYRKTQYGTDHHASEVEDKDDFRALFPITNYKALNPYFARVQKGDYTSILPEPIVCWVMTRGSTGRAKVLPAISSHL